MGGGASGESPHRSDSGGGPSAGSLADALEQAIGSACSDELEQLDHDVDLQQLLADAAAGGKRAEQRLAAPTRSS